MYTFIGFSLLQFSPQIFHSSFFCILCSIFTFLSQICNLIRFMYCFGKKKNNDLIPLILRSNEMRYRFSEHEKYEISNYTLWELSSFFFFKSVYRVIILNSIKHLELASWRSQWKNHTHAYFCTYKHRLKWNERTERYKQTAICIFTWIRRTNQAIPLKISCSRIHCAAFFADKQWWNWDRTSKHSE